MTMNIRRFPFVVLVVYLLFSTPLVAYEIDLDPPGPTTESDITLNIPLQSCTTDEYTQNIVGSVIKLRFAGRGICDPPFIDAKPVRIGRLPAGEYTVEVTVGALDSILARGRFVVVEADPVRPFEIRPFAVPSVGGLPLRITPSPCTATCDGVSVTVGGVEINGAALRPDGQGALWITAPPHANGLVDVVVAVGDALMLTEKALYYYAVGEPPDPSIFERVLFPVLFDSRGANGSDWRSEAVISNPGPSYVETWNAVDSIACIDYPCGERFAPGVDHKIANGKYPHGVLLWVPRADASQLSFALRVRDVSRESEGFGTEIPVVRESEMFPRGSTMSLLDVPLDPAYRVKLRIYAHQRSVANLLPGAFVTILNPITRERSFTGVRLLPDCFFAPCTEDEPPYGEIDLPPGKDGDRVNLYVFVDGSAAGPAWAVATVTNNATQQVTIVTPDGLGGEACAPCEVP
jgi:hypothetical protein